MATLRELAAEFGVSHESIRTVLRSRERFGVIPLPARYAGNSVNVS